jgi:hypothetical protein
MEAGFAVFVTMLFLVGFCACGCDDHDRPWAKEKYWHCWKNPTEKSSSNHIITIDP